MKKGIALLLATLMCLSLTACGGTGEQSSGQDSSGEDTAAPDYPTTNISCIIPYGAGGIIAQPFPAAVIRHILDEKEIGPGVRLRPQEALFAARSDKNGKPRVFKRLCHGQPVSARRACNNGGFMHEYTLFLWSCSAVSAADSNPL